MTLLLVKNSLEMTHKLKLPFWMRISLVHSDLLQLKFRPLNFKKELTLKLSEVKVQVVKLAAWLEQSNSQKVVKLLQTVPLNLMTIYQSTIKSSLKIKKTKRLSLSL
jgi:hypothetical protein